MRATHKDSNKVFLLMVDALRDTDRFHLLEVQTRNTSTMATFLTLPDNKPHYAQVYFVKDKAMLVVDGKDAVDTSLDSLVADIQRFFPKV